MHWNMPDTVLWKYTISAYIDFFKITLLMSSYDILKKQGIYLNREGRWILWGTWDTSRKVDVVGIMPWVVGEWHKRCV